MKALLSTVCAATIALSAVAPLQAAPLVPSGAITSEASNIIQVQMDNPVPWVDDDFRRYRGRGWDDDGRRWRRALRHRDRYRDYDGRRRYRHYRRWHDDDDDFWLPLGAFAAGALITGALTQPRVIYREPRVLYRGGGAHVEWCYNRYRSYRAYDNTFQPYHGPRRQCYSPYS